jgi:AcrR family transcriptional regulator
MPPIFSIEKRDEIHTNLLMIGFTLIKEKGIKRMTVDEVAERAGIGKGTFYHFFKSKEEFVHEIIRYNKERIYDCINNAVTERGGIDKETFSSLFQTFSFTGGNNVISHMTMEDEEWLKKKMPELYSLNPEKEEKILDFIMGNITGARENLNYHVIANMVKIMAMASESREDLYQDAIGENLNIMMNTLRDYIFEK